MRVYKTAWSPSVPAQVHSRKLAAAGLLLLAWQAGDID